ncbi:MAG TPA: flavodoxin-dependent (E)-4-hydroxy-3-methylbut-2-enyl-diphosphate synthase [Desulfurella acetivorans]|uniref:4-hydroxy-3-methylbut-2-en-1-yl diphosphate synthase (flavodoxin) n=1 Tax=Desulfurella acetivorans TaxID=33002 RepID=A0A7C6A7P8_DESAE|nr:flavodoxin-dependent (E)-4-hydroxy-3-methylbut-2-enyl-diphosphate synthase [Desulfurella acetivorans]
MSFIERKRTKKIYVGNIGIGGFEPISVQSMTNTDTRNIDTTLAQINSLYAKGCEIVRCAVVDEQACKAISILKQKSPIPIIADIHFDYKLAILSIENNADCIRINPGNIGSFDKVKSIVSLAKQRNVPLRIGVNSGSLEKDLLAKYGRVCVDALVESAYNWVMRLEDIGFKNFKLSIKSSSVEETILAYEKISSKVDYPLHVGLTEAGGDFEGIIKSTCAVSVLLKEGIGDTVRVSLTDAPEKEVDVAFEILNALGLRKKQSIEFISCPTCGRIEIDLVELTKQVKARLSHIKKPIKVAIMGCVVNALGEAREADLAIAGGRHFGLIIQKGKIVKKVKEEELLDSFVEQVEEYVEKQS